MVINRSVSQAKGNQQKNQGILPQIWNALKNKRKGTLNQGVNVYAHNFVLCYSKFCFPSEIFKSYIFFFKYMYDL